MLLSRKDNAFIFFYSKFALFIREKETTSSFVFFSTANILERQYNRWSDKHHQSKLCISKLNPARVKETVISLLILADFSENGKMFRPKKF